MFPLNPRTLPSFEGMGSRRVQGNLKEVEWVALVPGDLWSATFYRPPYTYI